MMREIKFRAWHKQDGYMILPEQCERFDINFTPKGFDGFSFNILFKGSGCVLGSNEHIELMQYTGLKDKNGKEGFFKDIFKPEDENEELYLIDWFEDTASWVLTGLETGKVRWIENREQFRSDFQINFSKGEIIGNIYENPKLLNP